MNTFYTKFFFGYIYIYKYEYLFMKVMGQCHTKNEEKHMRKVTDSDILEVLKEC